MNNDTWGFWEMQQGSVAAAAVQSRIRRNHRIHLTIQQIQNNLRLMHHCV